MMETPASTPPPFRVEPVEPEALAEARAFNEQLERLLATQPSVHTIPVAVSRRVRREGGGIFPPPVYLPHARDLSIPSRGGALRLRVLAPEGAATGVYLHIHGGGWTFGGADMQDPLLWALVQATGLVAVSVDYRLAPEHPYPAGPDDCEDAARWLLDRGAKELGAPVDCLTLGGESAGAHLSVLTLLRLRDLHGMKGAFRAANLVFGAYDGSMTPSGRLWGDRYLVLSLPVMEWFTSGFLKGRDREARRDPSVSPLYADLRDMPPALFTVGTADPLLDDSLFMAARWSAAGARADLRIWPEAIHGFTAFPLAIARTANRIQHEFLAAAVG
jgi:acetyl esterase